MYCPQCGAEYRAGISECADCGVSLVFSLPEEEDGQPDAKIVPVFRTTDSALLPIVCSLLESAGIEYFVQGEGALGLLPVGGMGSNVGRASLGAIIHVAEEDAESVKQMLAEVAEAEGLDEDSFVADFDKEGYDEEDYDEGDYDLEGDAGRDYGDEDDDGLGGGDDDDRD